MMSRWSVVIAIAALVLLATATAEDEELPVHDMTVMTAKVVVSLKYGI